jgi:[ribosomal protein S5]-alanine N-acetyltransferase
MRIETERLIIRDLEDKDRVVLPELIGDLEVSKFLAVVPYPYTQKDADWFVNSCQEESKKNPRENYQMGIVLKSTGELVGVVGLTKVNEFNKKGTLGYWLGKKYWRQGIMYEAAQRLVKFAFEELDLQRIDITAFIGNDGSNALIKKLGSTHEGVAKRYHRGKATGEFYDTNSYGLLKENFNI